jgi:integrase
MRTTEVGRKFKFTDTRVERWRNDPAREVFLYDAERPNLVLRLSAGENGRKTFFFHRTDRTRPEPGRASRTVKVRIGTWPELTVEKARDEVDKLNGRTVDADGVVPGRDRTTAVTLRAAFDEYMTGHVAKLATWQGAAEKKQHPYERLFRLYLEPHAGLSMDAIDHDKVEAIHQSIPRAKGLDARRRNGRKRGGREAANSVLMLLSAIFNRRLEMLQRVNKRGTRFNPCDLVKRFPPTPRTACLRGDEIPRFIDAIAEFKREFGTYRHTRPGREMVKGRPIEGRVSAADVLLTCLATGQRRGDVSRMTFSELNLDSGEPTWTIPARGTNKMQTAKTIALPEPVVDMLRERRTRATGDEVFPGARGASKVVDVRKTFRVILRLGGIKTAGLTPHSLRAAFVTEGVRGKHNLEAISRAVGHSSIKTTQRYANLFDKEKRDTTVGIAASMFANVGAGK